MSPQRSNSPPTPVEDCPFCAIAVGEDRSVETICEGDSWIAFFPPEPATPGHTLLIPRAHFPDLWSLEPAPAAELTQAAIGVGRAIETALAPEGMNLITSSGEAAEQTIFHVHLHLVPRWKSDGFGRIWPPEKPMAESLRENLADLVREACQAKNAES